MTLITKTSKETSRVDSLAILERCLFYIALSKYKAHQSMQKGIKINEEEIWV